jgi:hypothetical protein
MIVFRRCDGSFSFKGVLRGKLYLVDFISDEVELETCLIAETKMGWLWHHRLAHVGMRNIHKLQKEGHILGLTDAVFEKDRPCRACQASKLVGAPQHAKNIMITTPIIYIRIGSNKYGLVIADDYSHFALGVLFA